jgi:hypothetical protein
VQNISLNGGGLSNTVKYDIEGAGSTPGTVHFKLSLRQVTAPANDPTPAPTIEQPAALTQGLSLTFQAPPPSGGGHEECDPYCQGGFRAVPADVQPYSVDHCCIQTPIVVDVAGDGFSLTDARGGVDFDFNSDGYPSRIAWTSANSDDAWLALDRNADGRITLGAELFGNYTPQPPSESRNGFLALAELDTQDEGGNGDGVIDANDAAFERLRLWQDANHDGVSQAGELHTLPKLGLTKIELRYKESKGTDEHGNQFRYRAKVWRGHNSPTGRWAWDVFLAPAP